MAFCELKSNCFEVACAFAQHECKQAKAAVVGYSNEAGRLTIQSQSSGLLPLSSRSVPLYVATILPSHHCVLGVEPALSHAICDGIRNQGQRIQDASTTANVRKSPLNALFDSGMSRRSALEANKRQIQSKLWSEDETKLTDEELDMKATTPVVQCLDLVELERFARQRGLFDESPAGCLHRCKDRILVLTGENLL